MHCYSVANELSTTYLWCFVTIHTIMKHSILQFKILFTTKIRLILPMLPSKFKWSSSLHRRWQCKFSLLIIYIGTAMNRKQVLYFKYILSLLEYPVSEGNGMLLWLNNWTGKQEIFEERRAFTNTIKIKHSLGNLGVNSLISV